MKKYKIEFVYADWCGPCSMMKEVVAELETKREDVEVIKLNADEAQDFIRTNKVEGTPTFFIYKDGVQIDRFVGYLPLEEFEGKLK